MDLNSVSLAHSITAAVVYKKGIDPKEAIAILSNNDAKY